MNHTPVNPPPTDTARQAAPQPDAVAPARRKRRRRVWLWLLATLFCLIIVLPMAIIVGVSLWLTPTRLTDLVNREASLYLNADIHAENVDYSIWSTFPRFRVTTGHIDVRSRTLDNVTADIRRQLPDSADRLGSIRSFSGEINVVDLFMNRYVIHDVRVDGLSLNLVAYNDSINNYNIIPSSGQHLKRVPYISANRIALKDPGTLSYTSISTDTRASVSLADLSLTRLHGRDIPANSYRLELGGDVTAASAGLRILDKFPFSLAGRLSLRFNPFGVALSDYAVDLGEIHSRLSMSVGIGDDPRIESFDYKISNVSVAGVLGYIPRRFIPSMQGLTADLQVSATARLTSAWNLSSETFPSMAIDFKVAPGNLNYTIAMPDGNRRIPTRLDLRHSAIDCSFIFNGKHPEQSYIRIPRFNVAADGIDINLEAVVTRLTGSPLVKARIGVGADIARAIAALRRPLPVKASGRVNVATDLSFSVADLSPASMARGLDNLAVTSTIDATGLKIAAPQCSLYCAAGKVRAQIDESAAHLGSDGLVDPAVDVAVALEQSRIDMPDGFADIPSLKIATATSLSGRFSTSTFRQGGIPISMEAHIDSARFASPRRGVDINVNDMHIADNLGSRRIRSAADLLADRLMAGARRITLKAGDRALDLHNIALDLSLGARNDSSRARAAMIREKESDSDPALAGHRHSPEFISFDVPDALRRFMENYSLTTRVKLLRADIDAPGFASGDNISRLDLTVNDDSVTLSNLDAMIENTRINMRGSVSRLRPFMLDAPSCDNPLRVDLDLSLDTVNINALARTYVAAKGGMDKIPRHDTVTPDDSMALLVPRNLLAHVDLSARETVYTNLHLYNLAADVNLRGGRAVIPCLRIASDFGKASLDVDYDSSDIDSLNMRLGVAVKDINIVKFFRKFHALLEMMPEMSNLSGMISAEARMSGDIFPDMYVNVPSAVVNAEVEGRELKVHQSEFIRKITRMMLIRTDDDIHIRNIDVHALAHDNLLQLDPFNFEFDRYRLTMLGINNFNGELYYHIAVDKSPVPFPFSINIEGMFHHPKLRFGGPDYDTSHAERITSEIQEENSFNMVQILHKFLRAFIGRAARSDQ